MGRKKKRRSARKRAAEQAAPPGGPQQPLATSGEAAPVAVAPTPAPPPPLAEPPAAPASPAVDLQRASVPQAAPPPSGSARPDADLDLDLDADLDEDGADSYASLVAQVAGLPAETGPPARGAARKPRPADPEPREEVVEVLDLDDDEGASEVLDRLMAQAVVGAPTVEAEPEPEAPLIDLDVDEEVAPPRPRSLGAAPPATSPPSRLVQAAAAGALDDRDEPAISLDLGEVSTPEARARLLAQALAHAEHKEARFRVAITDTRRAARWKALASGVLFVLAGAIAVAPPEWVRPEAPAQLNAAARTRGVRMALVLQAHQVEAFRVRMQRLPDSLDELPGALQGVRYARSGTRSYQLIAYERDGNAIVFDSADPSPPFRILMSAWAPAEEAP